MRHASFKVTSNLSYLTNIVNTVDFNYRVAGHGNTQVKNKYLRLVLSTADEGTGWHTQTQHSKTPTYKTKWQQW